MTDFLGRFDDAAQGSEQRSNFFNGLLAEALQSMGIRWNEPALNPAVERVGNASSVEGPESMDPGSGADMGPAAPTKPWRHVWGDVAPDAQHLPKVTPSPGVSDSWMDPFNVTGAGAAQESGIGDAASSSWFGDASAPKAMQPSGGNLDSWFGRRSADAGTAQPQSTQMEHGMGDNNSPVDPYDYNQGPRTPKDLPPTQTPPADVPQQTPPCDPPKNSSCDAPRQTPPCDAPKDPPCDNPKQPPSDTPKEPPPGDQPKAPEGDKQVKMGDRMFTVHSDGTAEYGVVKGDCVWFVATDVLSSRLGKKPNDAEIVAEVKAISEASGLTKNGRNPDLIFPGDKLIVPPAPKPDDCPKQ